MSAARGLLRRSFPWFKLRSVGSRGFLFLPINLVAGLLVTVNRSQRFKLDNFRFSPDPSSSRQTFQKSDSPTSTLTKASIRLEATFVESAAPLMEAAFTRIQQKLICGGRPIYRSWIH